MNYSDKYKVIWLTPMRTATRSCAEIQKKLGFDRCAVHGINIPKDKEDYYLVTNIRSPYPRIVSLFKLSCIWNKIEFSTKGFTKWLDFNFNNPNRFTIHLDFLYKDLPKNPDSFVRTEFLETDLKNLWFINQNFDFLEETFNNQILHNGYLNEYKTIIPWQSFYNEEIADLVYSKTENQFKLYNYKKNYWKDGTP